MITFMELAEEVVLPIKAFTMQGEIKMTGWVFIMMDMMAWEAMEEEVVLEVAILMVV